MKTKQFSSLPESIQKVLDIAIKQLGPSQIILFGSRARGDHRENSDFDIAFVGDFEESLWKRFLVETDEQALTLYKLDLVRLKDLADDYKLNISKDGVALYE